MVNSILQTDNARLKFLYRKQGVFFNFHTKKNLVMSLIQCHFIKPMGISILLKKQTSRYTN